VPGFWPYGGVGADLLVMHASAAGSQIFNSLHQMREPQRRDFERHLCIATLVAVNAPGIRCPSRGLLALRGDANDLQELRTVMLNLSSAFVMTSEPFAG
jgi:hypothetical protein